MDSPAPPVHRDPVPAEVRPTLRFMLAHPAHMVALGFGSGLIPIGPGTAGTLFAWASYLFLQPMLGPTGMAWLTAAAFPLGWWACTVTARNLRVPDPGHIVWDEVLAFWIILALVMPVGFWGQLGAFIVFRIFDTIKRGPVGWADRLFHGGGWRGGLGILFDDLVAAFCTLLTLAMWRAA
jgi:phosphatidylglycerophosphatase A